MNDPALTPFDYQPRTRLLFGVGALERTADLALELGARNVLLVTDPGIVAAGHAGRLSAILKARDLKVTFYDQVRENPTTACVSECVQSARAGNVDTIIGLGGGSSMDTAKGCNFIFTNGGKMEDYWGVGKARSPMLPMIAIPTTAGTGSECQSFALIAQEKTHQKMACGDPKAAPRVAVLDPLLTVSQPPGVTARTGIDAIAHALESGVTRKRTPLSFLYSSEAFEHTIQGFPAVLQDGQNIQARGRMLLGAALAGMAIENSMLGAAHAAANPLTAHFGIMHGDAVGLMLPGVVRFNSADPVSRDTYAALAQRTGLVNGDVGPEVAVEKLVARLCQLRADAGLPRSLKEAGADFSQIGILAEEAAGQWTAGFNPRQITARDFAALYEEAFA